MRTPYIPFRGSFKLQQSSAGSSRQSAWSHLYHLPELLEYSHSTQPIRSFCRIREYKLPHLPHLHSFKAACTDLFTDLSNLVDILKNQGTNKPLNEMESPLKTLKSTFDAIPFTLPCSLCCQKVQSRLMRG
jgi:hypothetical protein